MEENGNVLKEQIKNLTDAVKKLDATIECLHDQFGGLSTRITVIETLQATRRTSISSIVTWAIMVAAVTVAYFK
jgi:cell division protein ZapA (FtsZ GTPase activity inhibitor)